MYRLNRRIPNGTYGGVRGNKKNNYLFSTRLFLTGKNDFEIAIKDIKNGDNLIEVETVSNNVNIDAIEKFKKQIIKLQIPIDTSNFFCRKNRNRIR